MINAIIDGETDPHKLAELAQRRLREKIPDLRVALEGRVTEHHRFLLKLLLREVDFFAAAIQEVSARIEQISDPFFREAVELLSTTNGIQQRIAEKCPGRDRHEHGAIPLRQTPQLMGRHVSRQPRECREA